MQNEEMRAKKPFLRPLIYLKISDGLINNLLFLASQKFKPDRVTSAIRTR